MSADCCPDWLNFWKVSTRACAHMLVQTPTHICNTVQVWCMGLPSLYCWTLADKTIPRSHLRPDPCWKELTEQNPPWGVCGARWGCAVGPCPSCSVRWSRTEAASPIRSGNCTQWKHSSGRSSWWRGDRKQRRGWGPGGGVLTERMFCYGSFVPNAGPDTVCFFFREIQVKICLCVCVCVRSIAQGKPFNLLRSTLGCKSFFSATFVYSFLLLHRVGRICHSVTLDRQHSLSAGEPAGRPIRAAERIVERKWGMWRRISSEGAWLHSANTNMGTREVSKYKNFALQSQAVECLLGDLTNTRTIQFDGKKLKCAD